MDNTYFYEYLQSVNEFSRVVHLIILFGMWFSSLMSLQMKIVSELMNYLLTHLADVKYVLPESNTPKKLTNFQAWYRYFRTTS